MLITAKSASVGFRPVLQLFARLTVRLVIF